MLNTGSGKWPCVKTCNCFVLGQAAQECLLCTPVCLQYLYFGVGNGWKFSGTHAWEGGRIFEILILKEEKKCLELSDLARKLIRKTFWKFDPPPLRNLWFGESKHSCAAWSRTKQLHVFTHGHLPEPVLSIRTCLYSDVWLAGWVPVGGWLD